MKSSKQAPAPGPTCGRRAVCGESDGEVRTGPWSSPSRIEAYLLFNVANNGARNAPRKTFGRLTAEVAPASFASSLNREIDARVIAGAPCPATSVKQSLFVAALSRKSARSCRYFDVEIY